MALLVHRLGPGTDHVLIRRAARPERPSSISAMVLPLMVMQSPCRTPLTSSIFSTCGTPPAAWKSVATYAARGLEVAQHRHFAPHALEVVDGPFHARRSGDGEVVQHRVGRAAGRHDKRDGVLDRLSA